MMWLQRIFHSVVTYGEPPADRLPRGEVWDKHLDEYRAEFGFGLWLIELIRGGAEHVWWRLTASGRQSTLPLGLGCLLIGISRLAIIAADFDDMESDLAEIHSTLGFLIVGVALSIRPWELSWKRTAPACLITASGILHLLAVNSFDNWFDWLFVAGETSVALGLIYIGTSGLRTRKALGTTRLGLWSALVGAVLVGAGQFFEAVNSGDMGYEIASVLFCWAVVFCGLRVVDLWAMQTPPGTSTHRLAGGGRQRHHDPSLAPRSPLLARSQV